MKKRVMSVLLALCMVVALVPAKVQAEELPKLATPSDLEWGISYNNFDGSEKIVLPGAASWKINQPAQNDFRVYIYRVGKTEPVWSTAYSLGSEDTHGTAKDFLHNWVDVPPEEGTYYFTVQALGDGENYSDGEISAASDNFEYIRPDEKLPGIQNPKWKDGEATFDSPTDTSHILGYEVFYLYSETIDGEKKYAGWIMGDKDKRNLSFQIIASRVEYKAGYYWFMARTVSSDITQYQNSDWSAISEAYYSSTGPTPPGDQKNQLTRSMFTVDTAPETYDGTAKTKAITSDLIEGTDYTVSYANNVNVGTATITITGKGDYSGTLTYTFEIEQKETLRFSIARKSVTLVKETTARPETWVSNAAASITWKSANPAVATVAADGTVTGVEVGKATITGTASYNGQTKTVSYTVEVTPDVSVAVKSAMIVPMSQGKLATLSFTYRPVGANITVTTSNPSVVQVGAPLFSLGMGTASIKAVGGGTATVTVTATKDGVSKSAACTVTVPSTEGEIAQKFVDEARARKGEGPGYFGFTGSWCALFVGQCAKKVGAESIIPSNPSCIGLY